MATSESAFRDLMATLSEPLPEATWSDPGDLSRISVEAMVAQVEGDARSLASSGALSLHGPVVVEHSVDLSDVGAISLAWQRAVTAVGAALEDIKSLMGRVPADITRRTTLMLNAAPLPGSLVLHLEPKSEALAETEPGGNRPMVDPTRPLADRASEQLIGLLGSLATASVDDLDSIAGQMRSSGPRVASAVRTLAQAVHSAGVSFDASWEEPHHPTARLSLTPQQAKWVKEFVDGRDLDADEAEFEGTARTVSDAERWLIETPEGSVKVDANVLTVEQVRSVRPGDVVRLRVRVRVRQQPDGTTHTMREALDVLSVTEGNSADE